MLDRVKITLRNARRVGLRPAALTVAYRLRQAWWQARFATPRARPAATRPLPRALFHLAAHMLTHDRPAPTPLAATLAAAHLPQGLALALRGATPDGASLQGHLTLEAIDDHILRLRLACPQPLPPYFSYATVLEPQPTPVVADLGDPIVLQTPALRVVLQRQPCRLSVFTPAGHELLAGLELGWDEHGLWLTHELPSDLQCYGCGERAFPLALRGRKLRLTTRDPETYRPGDDPIYINIPFLIELHRGLAQGLFFDSTFDATLDLGHDHPGRLVYRTTGPELRLDLLAGPTLPEVLDRYTALTGRMNLPPLWALGYHQSRWSYETADIVRDIAANFRQRQLPCDAIHLDIDYMDGFRCFTWNPTTFPDPAGLVADLHDQNFRAVAMIDPGIKVDPTYRVCTDGIAHDAFIKLPDGSLFHGPVWPGECYFPDFTNPRVRAWWGEQYRGLVELGIDGFWNDMNEPTIFGHATFPAAAHYDLEGQGGDHRTAQSVYGMQMVRATHEGLNRLRPRQRNWVFTRSAYAGAQRYASSWTGDNISNWEHLRLTPAMLLNLGLSGLAFTGCDVGGFVGEPTPELFARWISMAALTPFFRTHTAKHTPSQEPWSFGPEVETIARRYLEWRYRLLPYLYTAFWQCSQNGAPIMRPLFYADPARPAYQTIDDQWLLGDHLLVAPVLAPGVAQRELLLPPGAWYDFWTDELITGPATLSRSAPLDIVPLYVRAGAVLPLGPIRQHSAATPAAPLQLHIYPGEAESSLYEDDGQTLAHRDGAFRLTHFRLSQQPGTLLLTRDINGPYRPPYDQFHIILHAARPAAIHLDDSPQPLVDSTFPLPADDWRRLEIALA